MSQGLKDKAITYLRHLENREWADAQAMCAEKATVWHSDGRGGSTIRENISGMEAQIGPIESMRYDITRQFSEPCEVLVAQGFRVIVPDLRGFGRSGRPPAVEDCRGWHRNTAETGRALWRRGPVPGIELISRISG